jgi:uncharacterized protein DUF2786
MPDETIIERVRKLLRKGNDPAASKAESEAYLAKAFGLMQSHGIDMTRDISDRLKVVFGVPVQIHRVALNKAQVDKYQPPENPAKMSDSRAEGYVAAHGEYSWELDALEPSVLSRIIEANILHWCDQDRMAKARRRQQAARDTLGGIYSRWNEVYHLLKNPPNEE